VAEPYRRELDDRNNHQPKGATGIAEKGTPSRLAKRHRFTLYEAAYPDLALRRGFPLATLDQDLRAAARGRAGLAAGRVDRGPFKGPIPRIGPRNGPEFPAPNLKLTARRSFTE
jgi:hypothetical protein